MTSELEEKSADELERGLWIASRRYMRGEISMSELEEVEDHRFSQLADAIITLAKRHETWQRVGSSGQPKEGRFKRKHVKHLFHAFGHNFYMFLLNFLGI